MSGMRRHNGRNPSRDQRATVYTAEERETLRRGLRIIARMIARAHLRRQALLAETEPETPEDGRGR